MHPFTANVVDHAGNALEGALVEFEGTVDAYEDQAGTTLIDPLDRLTDEDGIFACWLDDGVYRWRSVFGAEEGEWQYVEVGGAKGDKGDPGDPGPQGPQGPPGATTGDVHYDHLQGIAEEVWAITHNLGKFPSVTVLDSANSEVEGQVDHIDTNSLTVTFTGAMSGRASLN